MAQTVSTPEQYLAQLPEDRKTVLGRLRETIKDNLPAGFEECINYGMIAYVVPHDLYPPGYHCDPRLPLPFLSLASQKNFVALYHMGLYVDRPLFDWFVAQYPQHVNTKLDMGKCCIRFKNLQHIPYGLIGDLCQKIDPQQWIGQYGEKIKGR